MSGKQSNVTASRAPVRKWKVITQRENGEANVIGIPAWQHGDPCEMLPSLAHQMVVLAFPWNDTRDTMKGYVRGV